MNLFPIEFYVPRNELDAKRKLCGVPLTCHVRMEKIDNTRKSPNSTQQKNCI